MAVLATVGQTEGKKGGAGVAFFIAQKMRWVQNLGPGVSGSSFYRIGEQTGEYFPGGGNNDDSLGNVRKCERKQRGVILKLSRSDVRCHCMPSACIGLGGNKEFPMNRSTFVNQWFGNFQSR